MKAKRITTNIRQLIKNKIERNKATFVINANECYWLLGKDKIKPEHFDLMLPIIPKIFKTY